MTSAKAFAAPKLGRSTARRGPTVVRAEKVSHGKGGEEGGATFNNDAFGMVAKNANYMLFATAVSKVRPAIPTAIHDSIDSAHETRTRRSGARSTTGFPGKSMPATLVFPRKQCPGREARAGRADNHRRGARTSGGPSPNSSNRGGVAKRGAVAARGLVRSTVHAKRLSRLCKAVEADIQSRMSSAKRTTDSRLFVFSDASVPSNYLSARTQTGCEGIMTSPGPITVFAPNDDAFTTFIQKIGKTKMEIMEHPNLPGVIKSHIVEGAHRLENMPDGTQLTTIAGTTITVSGGAVNGAKFKKNDIKVDNAILHAVDAIIEA